MVGPYTIPLTRKKGPRSGPQPCFIRQNPRLCPNFIALRRGPPLLWPPPSFDFGWFQTRARPCRFEGPRPRPKPAVSSFRPGAFRGHITGAGGLVLPRGYTG